MIPLTCVTCGTFIGQITEEYENYVKNICDNIEFNEEKKQKEISKLIQKLPLERYCCKRIILTSADIVKEILPIVEN